jgi:ABC-type Fe3+-siderophore transport system permease subunit
LNGSSLKDQSGRSLGSDLLLFSLLGLLAGAGFVLSLTSGSVSIPFSEVWRLMFDSETSSQSRIIQELRLPRALAAFATGAMLAMSGVMMQVLLRNPLADPYILGVSGGAAVGALGVIMLGLSAMWMPTAAFCGALLSVLLVFGLAGRGRDLCRVGRVDQSDVEYQQQPDRAQHAVLVDGRSEPKPR